MRSRSWAWTLAISMAAMLDCTARPVNVSPLASTCLHFIHILIQLCRVCALARARRKTPKRISDCEAWNKSLPPFLQTQALPAFDTRPGADPFVVSLHEGGEITVAQDSGG